MNGIGETGPQRESLPGSAQSRPVEKDRTAECTDPAPVWRCVPLPMRPACSSLVRRRRSSASRAERSLSAPRTHSSGVAVLPGICTYAPRVIVMQVV